MGVYLYTFIVETQGSTLVEQVQADNLKQACARWQERVEGKVLNAVLRHFAGDEPTPLAGRRNIWFWMAAFHGLHYAHIVRTDLN